eukprot:CAMPEP_0113952072 /NCGR_PEP_ID=MMETSP1339-20121228/89563_1 /TAXON_ID=94617 /ORGANISM="Fibrocapsa japonica" /LENGTH=201 /DNA_ID=CAMNT_0000960587 /DNA_START=138 /DNA_END=743 /DNA_ORIENTATION=- /assembly_acc=CAM_ASM_000762
MEELVKGLEAATKPPTSELIKNLQHRKAHIQITGKVETRKIGSWDGTVSFAEKPQEEGYPQAARELPLQKVVYLSSIGVERRNHLQFQLLNSFGVLNAKFQGEEAIRRGAAACGYDFVLMRAGRVDEATPFLKIPSGVELARGDSAAGNVTSETVAEAMVQALIRKEASNKELTVINVKGSAPTSQDWIKMMKDARMPVFV